MAESSIPVSRAAPGARAQSLLLGTILTAAMALPMLVLYAVGALGPVLAQDLRVAPSSLGWVTFTTFSIAAVLSPWAGPLTDRLGARRGLVLLFMAVALAYVAAAWVPSLAALAGAVAIGGVAQALCNPVTNLLIAREVAPAHKARIVGLKQAGVQGAALFAGMALPTLASGIGWRLALGLMAPISVLLAVTALAVTKPHTPGPVRPLRPPRPNHRLVLLMTLQLCVGVALSAFVTFLPAHAAAKGMSLAQAGALIAIFAGTGMLSRIALTPLAGRLPDESALMLVLLLTAAVASGSVLMATADRHWPLWGAAALMGASAVASNAVAMSMLIRDEGFGSTAVASGWLSAGFFAGLAMGSPLAGAVAADSGSFAATWWGIATVLCIAAMVTLLLWRVRRGIKP